MPSTHTSLNVHAVFSTKERRPLIKTSWKSELWSYLGGIVKAENAVPLAVGGVEDHVHLLLGIRPTHRLDYLLRDIKADSSKWVTKDLREVFKWQPGYAAFSVSPDRIGRVRQYIERQEEHHQRVSFEDEYLTLLDESGVPYDPEFLWQIAGPFRALLLESNVNDYPRVAHAHFGLGRAYMTAGRKEDAIRSFRKALEVDPSYKRAADALKEIDDK